MGGIANIPISVLDTPSDGDVHYGYVLGGEAVAVDKPNAVNPVRFVCSLGGQHFVIPAAEVARYRLTAGDVRVVDPAELVDGIE